MTILYEAKSSALLLFEIFLIPLFSSSFSHSYLSFSLATHNEINIPFFSYTRRSGS